jgi:hypothetical protein
MAAYIFYSKEHFSFLAIKNTITNPLARQKLIKNCEMLDQR